MKVLITGGCGFLGKQLRKYLLSHQIESISFDNLDPLCGGTDTPDLDADVTDRDGLVYAASRYKITHIAHLAAYGRNLTCEDNPARARKVNIVGTENVLSVANSCHLRAVVCSSNIVLSNKQTVYKETKKICEAMTKGSAAVGVDCMALRPSNMYGPGQSKTEYQPCAFAGLDMSFSKHGHLLITGNGEQTRDWVHVDDVARAFYLALKSDLKGQVLDICSGEQVSLNHIASFLNVRVKYTDPRPGDAKALVSNPEPAQRLLGFKAELKLQDRIWDAFPSVPRPVHVGS